MMADHSAGFVNAFRSHTVNEHVTATVALARAALGLRSGLVVNLGKGQTPGPQLVEALADHPIVDRGGEYDALDDPEVEKAAKRTRRPRLGIEGISTDGCPIQTALGALRRRHLVQDATAGLTREAHEISVRRGREKDCRGPRMAVALMTEPVLRCCCGSPGRAEALRPSLAEPPP